MIFLASCSSCTLPWVMLVHTMFLAQPYHRTIASRTAWASLQSFSSLLVQPTSFLYYPGLSSLDSLLDSQSSDQLPRYSSTTLPLDNGLFLVELGWDGILKCLSRPILLRSLSLAKVFVQGLKST